MTHFAGFAGEADAFETPEGVGAQCVAAHLLPRETFFINKKDAMSIGREMNCGRGARGTGPND